MKGGYRVLFYSSKESLGSSTSYQKFTAVGRVKDGNAFRVTMNSGFTPYRKEMEFFECRETAIHSLLEKLHFVEHPRRWGYKLMHGFLEIDCHDFELIAGRMLEL